MNEFKPDLYAFVDEYGTNVLDSTKQGVSNLFIVVAVLVEDSSIDICNQGVLEISNDLCGGAPLKSQRVAGDYSRRLKFLERLSLLPFNYYALIIDKDKIYQDTGLRYKKSFYKFINRMLYNKFYRENKSLSVFADRIGRQDFMDSFTEYFKRSISPDLFVNFSHAFVKSEETPLVQVADFVAGSLSYCFQEDKINSNYTPKFRNVLRGKEIEINVWPYEKKEVNYSDYVNGEIDDYLAIVLKNQVKDIVEEYESVNAEFSQMKAAVLRILLFFREFEDEGSRNVRTGELINRLEREGYRKLPEHVFRSEIIAKLRDRGILIAGSNDGFRLAISTKDILDYVKHDRKVIEPMLYRLKIARDRIKMITNGQYDIVPAEEFEQLHEVLNTFVDVGISRGLS